jgi:hypothetical protein
MTKATPKITPKVTSVTTTILILAANPKGTVALRLDEEIREIEEGLRRSRHRDSFQVIHKLAVRSPDVQRALLDHQPQIVHFCGHGETDGLILEDETGQAKQVEAEALAQLFELFSAQLDCVVLNACYSEEQAAAIAQSVPTVIGMNAAIGDRAALAFAAGFYEALGAGESVEFAFEIGRNRIQLAGIGEHLTPVLRQERSRPKGHHQVAHQVAGIKLENPEGQVGIASQFYVPSVFEERCYGEIQKAGSLVRIKSPHNMGKSSLMARVLAQAESLHYRAVTLDLQQANQRLFGDLNQFMHWFCASVGKPLGVKVKKEDYWDEIFGANDNSTDYFEKYLLKESEPPLVLAIDNFDRIFNYADIETDFCGLLRGWHERSRSHPLWGNLRLVIVYSQEPYLQKDINQSPFNVGLPIELSEFNPQQVQNLAIQHGLDWTTQQVAQVMALIGGHPYLVRSVLYHVAAGDVSLAEWLESAPTEAGIYRDHLAGYLKSLEDYPNLGDAMRTVLSSDRPVRLRSEEAFKLDSMGLVVRVANNVQPRCSLYRQYFSDMFSPP